jgi:acyl-coenzyme A thioesterase PaaI-like protein
MAMFADYQIRALRLAGAFEAPPTATLSLSLDFLAPARLGDWIEADAALVHGGRRYLFTQAILMNDSTPAARTTAIYATRPAEERDG